MPAPVGLRSGELTYLCVFTWGIDTGGALPRFCLTFLCTYVLAHSLFTVHSLYMKTLEDSSGVPRVTSLGCAWELTTLLTLTDHFWGKGTKAQHISSRWKIIQQCNLHFRAFHGVRLRWGHYLKSYSFLASSPSLFYLPSLPD